MKKVVAYVICPVAAFVLLAVLVSGEVAWAVFFGWIAFLWRVVPQLSANWGVVAVGCTAVVMFTAGIHWVGWKSYRTAGGKWRLRWTLAAVMMVFVLFAAGVGFIGVVHQTGWLLTSEEPLTGTTLRSSWGARSANNLRDMSFDYGMYLNVHESVPAGGTFSPDGTGMHSWETQLLRGGWHDVREIDFESPWNSPKNQKNFKSVVPMFINPEFRTVEIVDANGYGLSHYAANIRVMGPNRATTLKEMKNGTSNTILVGEVNANFKPWGEPVNWRDPAKGINTSANGFGGPRGNGGVNFLMADGSVRFMSDKTDRQVLRALSDASGGEKKDLDGAEK